jgi:hypothetical protein
VERSGLRSDESGKEPKGGDQRKVVCEGDLDETEVVSFDILNLLDWLRTGLTGIWQRQNKNQETR